MATIRKRGDYQWEAQIRRKGHPSISKTFINRADAELWGATMESEMGRGLFVDRREAESTSLLEALERYEKEVSVLKDGYETEKFRIGSWKRLAIAKRSLASLQGKDFAKFRDERLKTVKASTVQKDLAVISHLFNTARKEWGLGVTNPIENIKIPTADNSRERRLVGGEEERLLEAMCSPNGTASNIWMKPLVQLAIETAARQSELLALKWVDVDLLKGVARLKGKERADGNTRTKNKDKHRDVPLSSRARELLNSMPRSINGYVFPTTANAVKLSFSRACKRASIENLHFHDLRHEGTSRLAEKLSIQTLMKVTGHKDTRMLGRYYHPEMEKVAAMLG